MTRSTEIPSNQQYLKVKPMTLSTEILSRIRNGENPPLRPAVPEVPAGGQKARCEVPDKVVMLMQRCWSECPTDRPLFPAIKASIAALNKGRSVHLREGR